MTFVRALWASTKNTASSVVYYTARTVADWLETLSQHDDNTPPGHATRSAWTTREDR